ncbi:MAG: 2Fe-2S iron-sulfur cluster-binding protein [Opitutales bacterium]
MIIKIDGKGIEAKEGMTILDCAKSVGINIPSLCNQKGIGHRAGCMICAVFDLKTNNFVPSCVLKAVDGQEFEFETDRVLEFRTQCLKLILQEHKGDCVAPCHKACPYGFNIPIFLEYVSANNTEAIAKMMENAPDCKNCKQLCMKVCRRNLVDKAVEIVSLIDMYRTGEPTAEKSRDKRYSHTLGRPSKEDLAHLVETSTDKNSCLQCHCRKSEDCQLRDLATEHKIGTQKGLSHRDLTRLNSGKYSFESAKCVLCGECSQEEKFSMWGRGNKVLPKLLDDAEISEKEAKNCPVGAISRNFSIND